jgi:putative transposase
MGVTSSKPYFLGVRPVRVFVEFEVTVPLRRPDLVSCGLCFDNGLLVVLDGAKALPAARAVFGAKALIPRCTLHQRRKVADRLPGKGRVCVDAKLVRAVGHPDPEQRLRNAPLESTISIGRATNGNVTRRRDGQMVMRWTAAGSLNAQRSFRRIKGYRLIPQLPGGSAPLRSPRNPKDAHPAGAAA